jgi:hypothetical protein
MTLKHWRGGGILHSISRYFSNAMLHAVTGIHFYLPFNFQERPVGAMKKHEIVSVWESHSFKRNVVFFNSRNKWINIFYIGRPP